MTAVTYPRVIASEFTKLHSLRSSRISLLMALGLVVGLGLFVPWLSVTDWRDGTPTAGYNAVERSLSGIYLAQIAFGVLGAMVVTGEYATGSIRSTFAAVPRRRIVLAAKAAVCGGAALAVGLVASFAAYLSGQIAIRGTAIPAASLGDPPILRAVLLTGVYLGATALIGVGIGTIVRHSGAAIGVRDHSSREGEFVEVGARGIHEARRVRMDSSSRTGRRLGSPASATR